jgi:hypothetical protein
VLFDEELRRDDIEFLGHVLADQHQRLTAFAAGAVLGFVANFNARQMLRQGLTTGAFAFGLLLGYRLIRRRFSDLERFGQTGFAGSNVGRQVFIEEVAFGGDHGFALHAEFHSA